jgi:hypothetical protein
MPRHRADPSPPESSTGSQHETLTLARATAWYRTTPRARGIVAAASCVFVAGWAWNLTGLWR